MVRTNGFENLCVGLVGDGGIFVPPTSFSTAELIEELEICYPKDNPNVPKEKWGKPLERDWAVRHFGIERVLRDYERTSKGALVKPRRAKGGLYGTDLGVGAVQELFKKTGISGRDICFFGEFTATPDTIGLDAHAQDYYRELDLDPSIPVVIKGAGCGGFLTALKLVHRALVFAKVSGGPDCAVAVFQNCPSAPLATPELREVCKNPAQKMRAFTCHMAFSDGAVAFAFRLVDKSEGGFLGYQSSHKFGPDYELMQIGVGGNWNPPQAGNRDGAAYFMNGDRVKKAFVELMLENYDIARDLYSKHSGRPYSPQAIDSFVLHQASKPAIMSTLKSLRERGEDIPEDHVPMIMQHKGNLAVASGPYALTERLEKAPKGSDHLLMLLGAGDGGAEHGAAFFRKNY